MVMPQASAQVTFPVCLKWSLDNIQDINWLQYVCQLLEMCLIRLMRFEQSKVCPAGLGRSAIWLEACMMLRSMCGERCHVNAVQFRRFGCSAKSGLQVSCHQELPVFEMILVLPMLPPSIWPTLHEFGLTGFNILLQWLFVLGLLSTCDKLWFHITLK